MSPSSGVVVAACIVVSLGCLGCAAAIEAARRTRNWLYLICALGAAGVVAGIVGQRSFPGEDLVARLGQDAAERQTPGAWDAGVSVPLAHVKVTPVAVGGALMALAGLSLVLFFEPAEAPRREPEVLRSLEEDDAL